ncbi:hypothetical protein N7714_03380 [Pseudomonas aeruginosa]|uniref:hypothetical protein n=1 Tax=Pseudomonas aeruginosa TaxID=287 RepID=UPI001F4B37CD|nr:hypothetical protein [Pseudomonas aeruginosa]MDG9802016.1 hypothetical protein [Pseudomonas aeruginosa]MDG9903485.1 hypothetical protein [Pseudomonas aeruginosa]MDH0000703.1 hypothetical protein [Pseudomonas aeruginosa]MDH0011288.1 hypothetical protein [Pseudomonas aeruginosa]MDH0594742.1 hypothetical protein [Pseudomonas aeruginosa]
MNKANECTCPSGEGSLRWPCPKHPAVEQVGGDERAAFEAWATHLPMDRQPLRPDLYMPQTQWAWEAWQFRATLAQPSPAPELERPEVAEVAFVLRNIGAMDAEDIDGDNVDLRFEDAEGRDTGCDVSIVEYAEKAADLLEQRDRIVGELRAERDGAIKLLGQSVWQKIQLLTQEREAANARLHEVATACATAEQQRDAALDRVAELTATRNRYGVDAHYFNKNLQRILRDFESFTTDELASSLIILAKVADEKVVAQAQHSVPGIAESVSECMALAQTVFARMEGLMPRGKKLPEKHVARRLLAELETLAKLAAAPGKEVPQAWLDVQAERRRQITAEGWTPEHDDEHSHGQMARAAACYALAGSSAPNDETAALLVSLAWPWDQQRWKPTSARRDLVKACALALAEIERLDRAGISQSPQPGATTASS